MTSQAPSRATAARGSPLLRELRLSGAELEQSAPRRSLNSLGSPFRHAVEMEDQFNSATVRQGSQRDPAGWVESV